MRITFPAATVKVIDPPILHHNVYATGGGTTRRKVKVIPFYSGTTASTPTPPTGPTLEPDVLAFVTGLNKQTSYKFEVTATNALGESGFTLMADANSSSVVTTQNTKRLVYVSDYANDQVLRFDPVTGSFHDIFIQKKSGGLSRPMATP